jgi:acyl-CoA thioesterase
LVEVPDGVAGFGGALGGYVAALALGAMAELAGDRPARTLTVQLLAPVRPGAVDVDPAIERTGRSLTSASARLTQDAAPVAVALASFGEPRPGLERDDRLMPAVPPPEECAPLIEKPVAQASAGLLVEHRPAGGALPLSGAAEAEIRVWMRLLDDRPLDAPALAFLADSGPPALYATLTRPVPMPSAEIALHLAPEQLRAHDRWVLAVVRNRSAASGYAVEDAELWSVDGRLLVHARQLRRVLTQS